MAIDVDVMEAPLDEVEYPTPQLVNCPYGFYQRLRDEAPVHRLPNGDFVVSRYDDIVHIDRHPELFSNFIGPLNPGFAQAYGVDAEVQGSGKLTPWPLPFTDPPDHKLKRSLIQPLVNRDRLAEYEPMIRGIADDLIDTFIDKGSCNFKTEFAAHLPPKVFLRIFDVPLPDEPMIRAWMEKMQGQGFRHATPEQKQAQFVAADAAREYFQALILQRFENPGRDFLSEMVHAKYDRDGDLDLHYFVGEATTLYQAAYHNTVYMLSNTMLLFLQNPDQLERVNADLGLLRTAIDESLRRESPVQWLQRIVAEDTELQGVLLPKGAVVLILYGSANRDDRKFEDPERFWVDRPDVTKEQLAFGHGIHLCLGAPLARLEGIVAFEQVFSRLKNIRLAAENDLSNVITVNHRGPKTVNIEFDRA